MTKAERNEVAKRRWRWRGVGRTLLRAGTGFTAERWFPISGTPGNRVPWAKTGGGNQTGMKVWGS